MDSLGFSVWTEGLSSANGAILPSPFQLGCLYFFFLSDSTVLRNGAESGHTGLITGS